MNNTDRIRACREAGMVERCHVVPHLRSYDVARHTYGVLVILRIIWPDRHRLMDAALFHDTPERWTGDIPSQVIAAQPELRQALAKEDARIMEQLSLPCEWDLGPEDYIRFKFADRLELYLWATEEEAMGNQMVSHLKRNVEQSFVNMELPQEARDLLNTFRRDGWMRHSEILI